MNRPPTLPGLPSAVVDNLAEPGRPGRARVLDSLANAVADHLHRKREQELEEQHVRGYIEHPETKEELAEITAWASTLELEPWG